MWWFFISDKNLPPVIGFYACINDIHFAATIHKNESLCIFVAVFLFKINHNLK